MKKLCLSSTVIFSIVGIQLMLFHSNVFADVGIGAVPGASITPGDKNDKVEMLSEKVVFDIKKFDESSPEFSWEWGHYAHVTAEFNMKNVSSVDENLDVIFPIPWNRYSVEPDLWRDWFENDLISNQAKNFKVNVNGIETTFEYDIYEVRDPEYSWHILIIKFPVAFKANAETKITVEYDHQLIREDKSMYGAFRYTMDTGSHWKGSIGSGEIIFNFPRDLINTLFYEYNDEFSMSGNQLIWQFSDLEPDESHNIRVSYSPELFYIWGDRESYLENIVSNKEKGFLKWDYDFFDDSYYKTEYRWGYPVQGNPIYLLLPHPENAPEYSSSLEGFWLASLGDDKAPWVHYEFDAVYEVDAMRITSGVMQDKEGITYQLVSRPKKVRLIFSDGTSKMFELEDNPGEEILVGFDKVQISFVRVETLSTYPDYNEEDEQLGIEVLNFDVGRKIRAKETILGITLPEEFIVENSTTTRIDEMTLDELKSVENFTLEVVGKNKVVFHDTLDLTSTEALVKLRELSGYIDFSTIGEVSIDTDFLKMLNINATVTMYGLSFDKEPVIYKDGKVATAEEVSDIEYDKESGTLSFDVADFSTYEARERIVDTTPTVSGEGPIKGFSIFFLLARIIIVTVVGIGVMLVYRRKEINLTALKRRLGFGSKQKEGVEEAEKVKREDSKDEVIES